jgi:arsenate reductase
MNAKLNLYISDLANLVVPEERKLILQPLITYLQKCKAANQAIRLNFICTHNSRRSHLSQIWAQTMAHYFGIDQVSCYSSGTESTALFPQVIETLQRVGFGITQLSDTTNPVYAIKFAENEPPIIGFSKTIDAPFNPQSEFAAIMTCSQADQGCPFIAGAAQRIPVQYDDPKAFDHTPQMAQMYEARSSQIATEFYYVFHQLKNS